MESLALTPAHSALLAFQHEKKKEARIQDNYSLLLKHDKKTQVDSEVPLPIFYRKGHLSPEGVAEALRWQVFEAWHDGMMESWESLVLIGLDINDIVRKDEEIKYMKIEAYVVARDWYITYLNYYGTKSVAEIANDTKFSPVPAICFLRGPSVSVLIIISSEEPTEEFVVLSVQPRAPVARYLLPELPSGKIDETGDFVGPAKELLDNINVQISEMDLVNLTQLAFGDAFSGMYPSPGGCDEYVSLYMYHDKRPRTHLDIERLRSQHTGELKKDEEIALKIVPLGELWRVTPDSKSLSALAIYYRLKQSGILP